MLRIILNKPMVDVPEPVIITSVKYGLLYNWYAATDARNICADGWRLPDTNDVNTLRTYLGGNSVAGEKVKESGLIYWQNPNTATNESNFNFRGCGQRNQTGVYDSIKNQGNFWSTVELSADYAYHCFAYNNSASLYFAATGVYKITGRGIRIIKTTTTLTHGQTGIYTGNDGKIYRTICIGTQEWLADNLCETKFRNGDTIPEVTDNSAWAALTTSALCAYNNDWTNVLI